MMLLGESRHHRLGDRERQEILLWDLKESSLIYLSINYDIWEWHFSPSKSNTITTISKVRADNGHAPRYLREAALICQIFVNLPLPEGGGHAPRHSSLSQGWSHLQASWHAARAAGESPGRQQTSITSPLCPPLPYLKENRAVDTHKKCTQNPTRETKHSTLCTSLPLGRKEGKRERQKANEPHVTDVSHSI